MGVRLPISSAAVTGTLVSGNSRGVPVHIKLASDNPDPDWGTGLLKSLIQQAGNGGAAQVRLGSSHFGEDYGWWATGQTYFIGDMRGSPNPSPLGWKCWPNGGLNASVTSNVPPYLDVWHPINNPTGNWQFDNTPQIRQRIGANLWLETLLQTPANCQQSGITKLKGFRVSSFADAVFTMGRGNYDGVGDLFTQFYSPSATSIAIPTAHPTQKTFTASGWVSNPYISDSQTLGTCSDTFAIPVINTVMRRQLPAGLTFAYDETITLYGNANNFVVCWICRYDAVTGLADLVTNVKCGSGTFSSWTVKKERLLIMERAADITTYWYCLVQTNTAGVIVANSVSNVGTGTFASWNVQIGNQAWLPYNVQDTYISRANAIGYSVTLVFDGTGFQLGAQTGPTGTGWLCVYTGGPNLANPPSNIIIDTYTAGVTPNNFLTGFQNLTQGTHRVRLISVTSPSGASTNAVALIYATALNGANDYKTVKFAYDYDKPTVILNIGYNGDPQSEGEFIIKGNPQGLGPIRTDMPDHLDHAENNLVRLYSVDGVNIDYNTLSSITNPYLFRYQEFETCDLYQSGTNRDEDHGYSKIADYIFTGRLSRYGYQYYLQWTPVVIFFADQIYSILFDVDENFMIGGDMLAQSGEVMTAPSTHIIKYPTASFVGQPTYLFRGANAGSNYAVAIEFVEPEREAMWNIGGANEGDHQFEWRVSGGYKWRTWPKRQGTYQIGQPIIFAGRFYLGLKGSL